MFFAVAAGVLAVIIFAVLAFQLVYLNRAYPGVSVAGESVGGKTRAQIIAAVDAQTRQQLNRPITIRVGGESWTFTGQQLGLRVVLLTSSVKNSKKNSLSQEIAKGKVDITIGTHAIIQESVHFSKLGLAIIDEQHRFGVMQRAMLKKKGITPDVLVMTATPIPSHWVE